MSSFSRQLASGVFYNALSKYIGVACYTLTSMVLARLLTPEDFGVVAIANVTLAFLGIISDLGIGSAIVQNKTLSEHDLDSIFTFTVYLGFVVGGAFFLLGYPIAAFYENELLIPVCRWMALGLFIGPIGMVPGALMLRDKRFRFIAVRTIIFTVIGGVVALIFAWNGFGVYTLVVPAPFIGIAVFIVNYKQYPRKFLWKVDWVSIRKIASFSFYQFLFNATNYWGRNLDKLVVGKLLGMAPLGIYQKSYALMMMPLGNITFVITPVMHPILADYQNNKEQLLGYYLKIIKGLAFVGFPLAALLFFGGDEIILVFFGEKWVSAIPVFKILSLSAGLQIVLSTTGTIYQAANYTKGLFISGIFSTAIIIGGLFISILIFGTIEAVAYAWDITLGLNFFLCYAWLFYFVFPGKIMMFYRALISPLLIGGIVAGALYLYEFYFSPQMFNGVAESLIQYIPANETTIVSFISLVILSFIALIITLLYVQVAGGYDIIGIIKKRIQKQKGC